MITKKYGFGVSGLEIRRPEDMPVPKNLQLFEREDIEADRVCQIEFTEDLKSLEEEFRAQMLPKKEITRKNCRVLLSDQKECRLLNFEGAKEPYAMWVEESKEYVHAWVSTEVKEMLCYDTVFGSLLGLEKLVLQDGSLILHSAYMCRNGKAVLFSAPSGTGKSTQAELWTRYRGTRTVNGDKSLLHKEKDGWYAYGWPICGSSEICHNEAYPVEAIVMLHQAEKNTIERLDLAKAVKRLLPQITMNMWNMDFQMKVMDQMEVLASEVPVYELGCNISEDAVDCLEKVLKAQLSET